MKFTIFTTLIVGACAFSPAPTKPAFSTSLKAKSTPEWFTPAAVAAAGWAVAANVAFAAPAPVVFDQPQSSTVLLASMTTPGAPPTGEAGKSFDNGKLNFPKYKAGVEENRDILPKVKADPIAGDIDGPAKTANEQIPTLENALKAKVGGDIEEAKAALS